ncbi:unnamed protein product [Durusdinium trenchii]
MRHEPLVPLTESSAPSVSVSNITPATFSQPQGEPGIGRRKPERADIGVGLQSLQTLQGKNLILAGDSNDRQFFRFLCQHLTGRFDGVLVVDKMTNEEPGEYRGRLTWPEQAKTLVCHDEARNASVVFLFHYGLFSLPPQPPWYLDFAKRRMGTHFLGIQGKAKIVPSTDLAKFIWPQIIQQHLPSRPLLLLVQSSMWDAFAVLESLTGKRVSQMNKLDVQTLYSVVFSHENLTHWGWLQRASEFIGMILEGVHSQGMLATVLWRTNPNCPALPEEGSVTANALSGLFADAVRAEILQGSAPWGEICLVDWRKNLEIHSPKQCDKHHYTKEGYAAYLSSLKGCVLISPLAEQKVEYEHVPCA